MNDELKSRIEQLRLEAAECDLIAFLAESDRKQALFRKLAADLRMMAGDLEAVMPAAIQSPVKSGHDEQGATASH